MDAKTGVNQISVPLPGTSVNVLQPNPQRIGILLSSHDTVDITYSFRAVAVSRQGVFVPRNTKSVYLSREQLGSAIELPMQAISSAANANPSSVIEVNLQGVNNG
jgi:hypothetical protein